MQIDEWNFEIIMVACRKTPKHGEPFTANATILISNGCPSVENLLSHDGFKKRDREAFAKYGKALGFDKFVRSKSINGKRTIINESI